jgi:5'-3' exonuclease
MGVGIQWMDLNSNSPSEHLADEHAMCYATAACLHLLLQAGNDFLPNVPSLDIYDRPSGLDLLFAAYSAVVPKLGGPIAPGGAVNTPRLLRLFALLARDEAAAYKRRAVRRGGERQGM